MKQINNVHVDTVGFHERLQKELSTYPEKTVNEDRSVTIEQVNNSYFLVNDKWKIDFLGEISQFEEVVENYNSSNKSIHFQLNNPSLNLEVKYVYYQHLFNDLWTLNNIFIAQSPLRRMTEFLNDKYPKLTSLLELDIDKVEREYLFWLNEKGIKTHRTQKYLIRKSLTFKNEVAVHLRTIYTTFFQLTDQREEWEKEKWDIRILHDKYGFDYNQSIAMYYLDFSKVDERVREQVKKYFKQRLLSTNKFSWQTAITYLKGLPMFFAFIFSLEPTWEDIKFLKRTHIEKYIEYLHKYAKNNLKKRNSHPESYVASSLNTLQKFLEDIQRYEYEMAPETHVRLLIFPEDKPKLRKKSIDQIDYIPDYVLEQLFTHINDLHKDIIPVVWVAFKTGLRISEVLSITMDCLVQLNGQYSIETDIEKTYVKGHRIPIDNELADMLAVLIDKSKKLSNKENNPEGYIFVRYRGQRKGKPFDQGWVRTQLNVLAKRKNITDESGNLFHFKTHQFRHTYGVKMLNGGADILTVQELMAHASPEMTLRYAKLLDDTKRKAFESVIKQGVFSFDLNGQVLEIKSGEDIPTDILNALWQDHKLNAMDNPYGTCHARLNGNCPHMEAPPCLTCGDNQTPCKDLAVGFSELDKQKYELHIKTTTKAIEIAKQRGREDIAERNQKNLQRYQNILNTLQDGNVIFGRQDRVKRKLGVKND
ncbi:MULTISPECIES: tyrosine-type recombinase/integrase [Bacillus cereus group]|uniref:Tyrosine-type recombinase/integrase n=1 Tax=Bacillus mycoides TaxID=1405 RepID=A0ABX6Z1Y3_BACMY|nr:MULTISPECIES: tyrosine-type recombinase/integrase [Bacillus cereus group]AJH20585.1 phage integrase family protein [Bacillus mycoides]EEL98568.1 Transposition regulatory protein TnpB [Bacillus mycoides DSM 2048]MDR4236103.1 tyrosine-type recombinase/integrase [Bacillus mycoides]MED1427860.1 tyrosine-type recombinase/integrase [Bacillus mycoides]MED1483697.1 tyrosine-type recombinase/integrase [Bacillus mycoides]